MMQIKSWKIVHHRDIVLTNHEEGKDEKRVKWGRVINEPVNGDTIISALIHVLEVRCFQIWSSIQRFKGDQLRLRSHIEDLQDKSFVDISSTSVAKPLRGRGRSDIEMNGRKEEGSFEKAYSTGKIIDRVVPEN
jgi:hypothetical protein